MHTLKKRLYQILETAEKGDTLSRIFDVFIITLIITNVLAVVVGTVKSIQARFSTFLEWFEIVSVIIFTIEYLLRLWTCTISSQYQGAIKGRLRHIFSFYGLIDLLAILPFYLPMVMPVDLRFIRAFRLFRMFRILKIGRYGESMKILQDVLQKKKEELWVALFVVIILLMITSSLMYFVETNAQPDAFSSIPQAMWWGVATLTTVGYGDVYPITPLGKMLGAIIALLGIGVFGLPAGILASGLFETVQRKQSRQGN